MIGRVSEGVSSTYIFRYVMYKNNPFITSGRTGEKPMIVRVKRP